MCCGATPAPPSPPGVLLSPGEPSCSCLPYAGAFAPALTPLGDGDALTFPLCPKSLARGKTSLLAEIYHLMEPVLPGHPPQPLGTPSAPSRPIPGPTATPAAQPRARCVGNRVLNPFYLKPRCLGSTPRAWLRFGGRGPAQLLPHPPGPLEEITVFSFVLIKIQSTRRGSRDLFALFSLGKPLAAAVHGLWEAQLQPWDPSGSSRGVGWSPLPIAPGSLLGTLSPSVPTCSRRPFPSQVLGCPGGLSPVVFLPRLCPTLPDLSLPGINKRCAALTSFLKLITDKTPLVMWGPA